MFGEFPTFDWNAAVPQSGVTSEGSLNLYDQYASVIQLNLEASELDTLLAVSPLHTWIDSIDGQLDADVDIALDFRNKKTLDVSFDLESMDLEFKGYQMTLSDPSQITVLGSNINIQPTQLEGKDLNAHVQGNIDLIKI